MSLAIFLMEGFLNMLFSFFLEQLKQHDKYGNTSESGVYARGYI
jgi:hypothetical protein